MPAPTYPNSARRHYRRLQRLQGTTVAALRRAWRRMEPLGQWQAQYVEDVGPKMTLLMLAAQTAAVRQSDAYVAELLAELGLVPDASPGVVNPAGLVGVAGDGRPVESLLAQSVPQAARAYSAATEGEAALSSTIAAPAQQALDDAEKWIDMVSQTIIADAARAAESVAIATHRNVGGWVRMLNPPSCSRCAILAGRFYRWNDGFDRHPRCDCVHVPVNESVAGDLRVDPNAYFDSLDAAEQDRIFTKAGAQAIRDGADPAQVVNARRDMYRATEFGKNNNSVYVAVARTDSGLLYTTEGATTRGRGFRSLNERFVAPDGPVKTRIGGGTRYSRATTVRMMPESIYDIATDREDAIRLLKLNGFIT